MPGVKAFTAAVLGGIGSLPGAVIGGILIGLIETLLVGLFLDRLQRCRRILGTGDHPDLPAARTVRPAGCREGLIWRAPRENGASINFARSLRDAGMTALLAFGLFLPLIGIQTVNDSATI